ncbi:MAG: hypothetical protein ALAOOOJD_02011 [bacterium]|nr:hypothetical protein [bacterium]
MKLGRNDPCHCGSGKKYKKCCLEKDEAANRTLLPEDFVGEDEEYVDEETDDVLESETETENDTADWDIEDDDDDDDDEDEYDDEYEEEEDDDESKVDVKAVNQRWEEFEKQDYEGKIALFLKTVEEPELMDDEMAFEMLNTLYDQTTTPPQRERYDTLVEKLRERLPNIYSKSAHFYLQNCITNAVLAGRFERVPAMMNELARRAGKDIDVFNSVVEELAYYGQLSTLIEAMHLAWPKVKRSGDIVPWGIDEFAGKATQNLVFDYVERHPAATSGDAELFERLKFFNSQVETARIDKFIALLAGRANRQWTRADFTFKPANRPPRFRGDDRKGIKIPKPIQQNLFDLSLEFQGRLRRETNMPLVKSELGREQLVKYFIDRLGGELEPRQSMLEAAFNRPKPKTRSPEFYLKGDENSVAWLCPDRETLDHCLAGLFHLLSSRPYTAATMFELIPAWLRFLESYQLVSAALHEQTLQSLRKLTADLQGLVPKINSDPALQTVIKSWGENTAPEKAS